MKLNLNIPNDFYNEEVKNGFKVSNKRKRIWAVELDLINEFDKVCKKYGIRYYIHGGTLLGAVRHKGFIPWDDDADIVVPRKDYERLKAIGPKAFVEPYFFQNIYTDNKYLRVHSQLRNSYTCGLRVYENDRADISYNRGIFIDIFVLDDFNEDPKIFDLQITQFKKTMHAIRIAFSPHSSNFFKDKAAKLYSTINKKRVIERFAKEEKKLAEYNTSNYFGNITFFAASNMDIQSRILRKEWYQNTEYLPFEMLKLPAPADYACVLESIYGPEYMIPKQMNTNHGGIIADTEHSYIDVLATTTPEERLKLMDY